MKPIVMFAKEQRCNSETNLASELIVPAKRQLEIKQGEISKTNFMTKDPKKSPTPTAPHHCMSQSQPKSLSRDRRSCFSVKTEATSGSWPLRLSCNLQCVLP